MRQTIWKYEMAVEDWVRIVIPDGARFLKIGEQDRKLCLWVLVDLEKSPRAYYFRIFGTGQDIPECIGEYIGTAQIGSYVWHVFEETAKEDQRGSL